MYKKSAIGCTLLMAVVSLALYAAEQSKPSEGPSSALVVVEGVHSRDGVAKVAAFSILDGKAISQLEAFFPGYRGNPSSDAAGGWEAGYRVYFTFDSGRTIRLTVSRGGKSWTAGEGDLATRGDFPPFVTSLERKAAK